MPKVGKGVRCQYDREAMDKAVIEVNRGDLSIRKAAQRYNVPRSSLHDRVSGRVDVSATPGKQTVFPGHVEAMLAAKIKQSAEMGFGLDRQQLKAKAARLAIRLNLSTPFKNGVPGDDWVNAFIKRHSISFRAQIALSTVRSRMLNPTITEKYFQELHELLFRLNLSDKPNYIWNMDETSVCLTHKPTRVFAAKGQRNVPGRVGNSREAITVTACVSAAGQDVPPMVVVKGKTRKSLNGFNVRDGPFGTKWTYQSKGWMEESLGTEWFKGVFIPNIGPHRPQILILDSHSSHETLDLIECAKADNIVLFALPPHTTQWLNPLDKTIFGPFSKEYNKKCTSFMAESPNNLVCKWVWPSLFKFAYERAFTKHNITQGFAACGIYPCDKESIPKNAFMPSNAFDALPGDPQAADSSLALDDYTSTERNDIVETNIQLHNSCEETGAEVLATANQNGTLMLESVNASELLDAIMQSGVNVTLETQDPSYLVGSPTSPKEEIDKIFQLPQPVKTKATSKRKLTSHRLLTSDEIINEKTETKRKKEEEALKKEERKKIRVLKQQEKRMKQALKAAGKENKATFEK